MRTGRQGTKINSRKTVQEPEGVSEAMRSKAIAAMGTCLLAMGLAQAQQWGASDASQTPVSPASEPGRPETGPTVLGAAPAAPPDNTGLHWGPLRASPGVDISFFYDNNPTYSHSDKINELAFRVEPVLDVFARGNEWDSYMRAWYIYDLPIEPAQGSTENDIIKKAHWGETFGINKETPRGTILSLTEFYEFQNRENTVLVPPTGTQQSNASWQDRQSFIISAGLHQPLGERTGLNAGASYSDLWYDNPALYGWNSIAGTLGLSRQITPKSDLVFDFGADQQTSEGSRNDSSSYRAMVGFGSRPTAKSSYRAEVGAMFYDYNGGGATAANWTYNLSGAWAISRRLSATVNGSANFQPSELDPNNYTLVQTFAPGLSYQATPRLTTTLSAIYRREDYAETFASTGQRRLDNQFSIYGRASYRLQKYISMFVGLDVSKNFSTIGYAEYDRLFLEGGISLRF